MSTDTSEKVGSPDKEKKGGVLIKCDIILFMICRYCVYSLAFFLLKPRKVVKIGNTWTGTAEVLYLKHIILYGNWIIFCLFK